MKHIWAILLFLSAHVVSANDMDGAFPSFPKDTFRFPEDWLGYWEGTLQIHRAGSSEQTVDMALDLQYTSTPGVFKWSMFYDGEERPYELIVKDPARGLYIVDEKNTIAMESYLLDRKLWCCFSVEGTLLLCTYEKVGNKLLFEVMAGPLEPVSITGGQLFMDEAIPSVKTYGVMTAQRAVLKRKK